MIILQERIYYCLFGDVIINNNVNIEIPNHATVLWYFSKQVKPQSPAQWLSFHTDNMYCNYGTFDAKIVKVRILSKQTWHLETNMNYVSESSFSFMQQSSWNKLDWSTQNSHCIPVCPSVDRQNIVASNQYCKNIIMQIKIYVIFFFIVIIIF